MPPSAWWAMSDEKPLKVIIIGGSLAGLMHGVMLKRHGHNVRILDRSLTSARTDQAAGMGTGPQGREFFEQHDLFGEPYSFACPGFQFLDKDANIKRTLNLPLNLTSWNVLYYRLRANFDAYESEFCPNPPSASETDGSTVYDLGKRATNVVYADNLVTVEFEDLIGGGEGSVHADLVIAADGSNSSVRNCLLPSTQRTYSGYVAWRGTVPESEASQETRQFFDKRFNAFTMKRGYIVGYAMPGPDGSLNSGDRLLNYVWYFNCPSSSSDFKENMTDIDGRTHRNTLPAGKMRPDIWSKHKAHAAQVLTAPFLELVNKTSEPFISTVNDCTATQASFFDGRLLLVGEALTLLRPHTGMSFNHAAVSCLLLKKVLTGEIDMVQWEREVLQYRERTMLLAIVVGSYFQFGIFGPSFLLGVIKLGFAIFRQQMEKLSWRLQSRL
ncbi:MAG: hypothetical protein Q9207_008037 [Kuettlingeria erythrocarpa]